MLKQIVCFANSRKPDGKCFAGKDIHDKNWIRPVSNRKSESLHDKEECIRRNGCKCEDCVPQIPKLLDIIEIDLAEYVGSGHQSENYLIKNEKWEKIGVLNGEIINEYLDFFTNNLWIDGYEARHRKNDRIPSYKGHLLNDSLKLIEVLSLKLSVVIEGADFGNPHKKVNGVFQYNNSNYIIPVTDEVIEKQYKPLDEGVYQYNSRGKRIIMCLSMGNEYNGFIYKFIAGIMTV